MEGHSVHRVAALHRQRLVGKIFRAVSPNGRFKDGAKAIDGKVFASIEAVGKNLFAFFGDAKSEREKEQHVVVHVHFGMAGNWAVYDVEKMKAAQDDVPEPSNTNRLRLEGHGIIADLSAMTVQQGDFQFYLDKRKKLGEDPLRNDANPDRLWERVQTSKKSIGALIMDQSFFTGPGNIYRAEILFKAGVHPDKPGKELQKIEFDQIWFHTVALLKRGFETGSILTVDPDEAKVLGNPRLRRYIYNRSKCPRCFGSIKSWQIAGRTCYACLKCQPMTAPRTDDDIVESSVAVVTPIKKDCVPFNSRCAPDDVDVRLGERGANGLTVQELKVELASFAMKIPSKARKKDLVKLLEQARQDTVEETKRVGIVSAEPVLSIPFSGEMLVSPEEAAKEKAAAGESLAVEHIAELAPKQARQARSESIVTRQRTTRAKRRVFAELLTDSSDKKKSKRTRGPRLN